MAGLTSTGFTSKTLQEITDSINARLRSSFGSGVETSTDSIVSQIVNPIAIEIKESWDGTRLTYEQMNPNAAEGVSLDNVGAITNTPRVAGAKSTVVVQVSGTEGSVIPIGFQRGVATTGELFQTTATHTLPATGSQPLSFTMTALNDGAVVCIAGTLTQGTLPSGISTMVNAVDATVGSLDETDEEYRVGRISRLQSLAGGTVIAIRDALLTVTGVTGASVFENDTGVLVGLLPPHSINALVAGGADQDIWNILGVKKGAGTYTTGAQVGTYIDPVDSQPYTMRFDRVTSVNIYVTVTITSKDAGTYPATGDADIETAILALTWAVGEDVTLPKLQSAVTATPGIITYTLFFDTSASPSTNTTITISATQQADFNSTRTTVTS